MRNIKLLIICYLLFFAIPTHAARLFLSNPISLNEGETKISLMLDSENESLNAFEGRLSLPPGLDAASVDDGGSIISLWVNKPVIQGREVQFAGGLPGGFQGGSGLLFSLIVRDARPGNYGFKLENGTILINDGLGTEVSIKKELSLNIPASISAKNDQDGESDVYPPDMFNIFISQDPDVYYNQYFVAFATTDKGSGIDHYEVSEDGDRFLPIESPYQLKNQPPRGKIVVRAYDRSGNYRDAYIEGASSWPRITIERIIYVLISAVFLIAAFKYKKFRQRKRNFH